MGRWFIVAAVVAFSGAGCGGNRPVDKVTYIASDDPRMNAAMEKARANVQSFITALQSPGAAQSGFAVKMAFTDGGETEHMWLTPVTFDGEKFSGTVSNEPEKVKSVRPGQTVTVGRDKISDWMYVDDDKLVGGETLRVLRDTATPAERAEFDRSVPFTIE